MAKILRDDQIRLQIFERLRIPRRTNSRRGSQNRAPTGQSQEAKHRAEIRD